MPTVDLHSAALAQKLDDGAEADARYQAHAARCERCDGGRASVLCHEGLRLHTLADAAYAGRTTPADPVPVPRHLSEEERALWEKIIRIRAYRERCRTMSPAINEAWANAHAELASAERRLFDDFDEESLASLLTALSSEREAGEKNARDAARAACIAALRESCPAWAKFGSCAECMKRAVRLYPLTGTAAPSTETPR